MGSKFSDNITDLEVCGLTKNTKIIKPVRLLLTENFFKKYLYSKLLTTHGLL